MKPTPKKGIARIWAAFCYSLNGLRVAVKTEAAFRQELILFAILLVTLFFLPVSITIKCLLLFANTIVLIVELVNSAIESIVDLSSPEYHHLAKRAKDLGSAAVFVSLCLAGFFWLITVFIILQDTSVQVTI